jgi:hypothetical protein
MIRAAWLIRLIACDVEDFALDCDVAETAVHPFLQLSVSIPAGRGAEGLKQTFALRENFFGDRIGLGGVELHGCLGLKFAGHCDKKVQWWSG